MGNLKTAKGNNNINKWKSWKTFWLCEHFPHRTKLSCTFMRTQTNKETHKLESDQDPGWGQCPQ